ncbi:stalk domain-containing protein [Desulforamulus ferrireducens]|uniref:Copper amine oxidase-like N-terminal domain-containing protein n=1 Tax=Desulforamulus ferrireducens TaxID=1833852 RepID=A0A1S6J015_9FIRM|nr:stalk domain-containing protein [Desulforamulus ferrireducens]AQS60367.1 hypothetical protein B0537_15615 [Desulforamulus ferrireducens]
MKKILLPLSLSMLLLLGSTPAWSEQPIQVIVDKKMEKLPYPILMERGTTLIPIRFFSEKLNAQVEYFADINAVYIKKGDKTVQVNARTSEAYIDGKGYSLNGMVKTFNDRIYVPLRFLGEVLGTEIQWNSDTRQIIINTETSQEATVPQKDPRVIWEKELTSPISAKPLATPNGMIYVPNGHNLTALDEEGNTVWSQDLGKYNDKERYGQKIGTPVQDKNNLYFATSDFREGDKYIRTLYSIKLNGQINWSLDSQSRYEGEYSSTPVIPAFSAKDNLIYFRTKEGVTSYIPDPIMRHNFKSDYEVPLDPIIVDRNEVNDDIIVVDRDVQGRIYLLNKELQEEWSYPITLGKATGVVYDSSSRRLFVALEETSYSKGAGILCLDLWDRTWKYQKSFGDSEIIKMQPVKGELYVSTGTNFYKIDLNGNIKTYRPEFAGIKDFYIDSEGKMLALFANGTLRKYDDETMIFEAKVPNAKGFTVAPSGIALVISDNIISALKTQ